MLIQRVYRHDPEACKRNGIKKANSRHLHYTLRSHKGCVLKHYLKRYGVNKAFDPTEKALDWKWLTTGRITHENRQRQWRKRNRIGLPL